MDQLRPRVWIDTERHKRHLKKKNFKTPGMGDIPGKFFMEFARSLEQV